MISSKIGFVKISTDVSIEKSVRILKESFIEKNKLLF